MQHASAPPSLPDSAGVWKSFLTLLRLDDAGLINKLLQTAVILALAWLAMWLVRGLARRIERAARDHDPTRVSDAERRGRTLAGLMQSIGTAVITITALLTVLDLFVNIAPLLANPTFQSDGLLIITFDESDNDNTHGGGRVFWLALGPKVKPGFSSATLYQEQNTLRLMAEGLGLTDFPGAAATASNMSEFFTP